MKKGMVAKSFFVLVLAILISSPFVFAGFFDWFGKMTGFAPSDSAAVNVTLGNNAPQVFWVEQVAGQSIIEANRTNVYFLVNVTDIDLVATLVNGSAEANFTYDASNILTNSSCVPTKDKNATMRQFNCTIEIRYYDPNGVWSVNFSIRDNNGAVGENTSTSFTLALGNHINLTTSSMAWASLTTASVDAGSDDNPVVVNNTGNANGYSINITAYDLVGETDSDEIMKVENFSVSGVADGCSNTNLINETSTTISGLTLNRGPGAAGTEDVYFCIEAVNNSLSEQSYSSASYGNGDWIVQAVA